VIISISISSLRRQRDCCVTNELKEAHDRSRSVVLSYEESRQVSREVAVAKSRNICLDIERIMTRFSLDSLTRIRSDCRRHIPEPQNIFLLHILSFTQYLHHSYLSATRVHLCSSPTNPHNRRLCRIKSPLIDPR